MQIVLFYEDSVTDGSAHRFGFEDVNSTLKHLKVTKIQMLQEN